MTALAVTNTSFPAGSTAVGSQVSTNFTDIVNYVNNRNSGSSTWDTLLVTSSSAVPFVTNNSTGTSDIAQFQDNGSNVFSITNGCVTGILNGTGLGIGTSSPSTALHIVAGGSLAVARFDNSTGGNDMIQCQKNGSNFFIVGPSGIGLALNLYGSGTGVFAIGNASVAPTVTVAGGGLLYAEAGALKWRGSSGTITTLGAA